MTSDPGRKKLQHLVEGEAYRRIMAGEAPATLNEFVLQLSDWLKETFPAPPLITPTMIENQIRETWHRRHEMIRGGDA
jgi:hypothetical protein